jgi:hypothetical protein
MICLWDRLPDDIQREILAMKRKAELKDKDLFWYNFGERIKNMVDANYHMIERHISLKKQKPNRILIHVFNELMSDLEEVMFKDYPRHLVANLQWEVKGKSPIQIFYGDADTKKDLPPAELVQELIDIQIHYDLNVRGTVDTGTMVYNDNGTMRKWVNNYYQKKIDASFAKINKLLFGTEYI